MFFRLHYHDAVELAGELDPAERAWYVELLSRLPRGEAVFRSGADRPVSFTVLPHTKIKSSRADIAALRQFAQAQYELPRTLIEEEIERRYQEGPRDDLANILHRAT